MHFLEEIANELNLEDDLTQLASGEFVKKRNTTQECLQK
jgi:hypothetical protein